LSLDDLILSIVAFQHHPFTHFLLESKKKETARSQELSVQEKSGGACTQSTTTATLVWLKFSFEALGGRIVRLGAVNERYVVGFRVAHSLNVFYDHHKVTLGLFSRHRQPSTSGGGL
jgi:hypothetical protein